MAEVRIAIAKTPSQAEKLGRTITKTISISESEARVIRDYYVKEGKKEEAVFGAFVSIMVGVGTRNLKAALNIAAGTASGAFTATVFKSYYSQLADKFDMITSDTPVKCKMIYQYKRLASNDGFYWLKDIKVL